MTSRGENRGDGCVSRLRTAVAVCVVVVALCGTLAAGNTRICTHCCDEVYPGNGTPAYFLIKGEKGDQGDRGPDGPRGARGERGEQGVEGAVGPEGRRGERGERGQPAPLNPRSAFSVARTKVLLGNDSTPQLISFDKTFVNEGDQFSMSEGRFVCKYAGIYFFTYTVQSYLDKFVGVQLMKNNQPQVILYANSVPRRIMQSQSVMLRLEARDVVWLRQAKGSRFAVYGNQDVQITFNGFLIHPDVH